MASKSEGTGARAGIGNKKSSRLPRLIRVALSVATCSFRRALRGVPRTRASRRPGAPCDMDSFEFNKFAGAVLGTALFVMALSIVSEMIYEPAKAAKPGYVIAVVAPEPGTGGARALTTH